MRTALERFDAASAVEKQSSATMRCSKEHLKQVIPAAAP
jgi:hypothetical protein